MTNETKASYEWATRPADERFWNLSELAAHLVREQEQTITGKVRSSALRAIPRNGDIAIAGANLDASPSNWSFGQVAGLAGAPASYLAKLPSNLAADCINVGLDARSEKDKTDTLRVLLRQTENGYKLRAMNSEIYGRITDLETVRALQELTTRGWRVPPARPANDDPRARPATEEDVLSSKGSLSVQVGDLIAPAGVYCGDRDMFIFMVNEDARIDDGSAEGLSRGFFVWNSEVGARSWGALGFLYAHVCGNHIVWGAKRSFEVRIRHVGNRAKYRALRELSVELRRYSEKGAHEDEQRIIAAKNYRIAGTVEDVVKELFGKRKIAAKRVIEEGIETATEVYSHLDPLSVWGIAQGITQNAQKAENADARTALEASAGKVMELAF